MRPLRCLKELKSHENEIVTFKIRYDFIYQGLNHLFSNAMNTEMNQESELVDAISKISQNLKNNKNRVIISIDIFKFIIESI